MRKSAFIVLALLLTSVPATAGSVGIFGANYSPSDTDSSGGVGVDLELGNGRLHWQLRATLFEALTTDANPESFDIDVTPIDLGANYDFDNASRITPHVGGGFTYAVFHFHTDTTTTVNLPNSEAIGPELGFYAEVGVDFEVGRTATVFADVLLRSLEAEIQGDDLGLAVDQKLDMSGAAFHLGIAVRW